MAPSFFRSEIAALFRDCGFDTEIPELRGYGPTTPAQPDTFD
jgi:hypothetical protein